MKKQISLWANEEEIAAFERIKKHHHRKTDSDMLRMMITDEDEKILKSKISNESFIKLQDQRH